jgi:lincosamide nucleotidyltransferase A/C/D/E
MTASDLIRLYTELENLNIKIWVDGSWCVDAFIGKQTRPHKDFDIAIQRKDVASLPHSLLGQSNLASQEFSNSTVA